MRLPYEGIISFNWLKAYLFDGKPMPADAGTTNPFNVCMSTRSILAETSLVDRPNPLIHEQVGMVGQ